jgi:hypothetical protein
MINIILICLYIKIGSDGIMRIIEIIVDYLYKKKLPDIVKEKLPLYTKLKNEIKDYEIKNSIKVKEIFMNWNTWYVLNNENIKFDGFRFFNDTREIDGIEIKLTDYIKNYKFDFY